MVLLSIILATLATGIGSVWVAALLMRVGLGGREGTQHLLSLAAGALLATAFMHLLPEAFESQAGAHDLFATLLVGVVFFFLLDKAELWHHGHEHSHGAHGGEGHGHGHAHHGHAHTA
ncbi:MAG: ZIP family metal transporter, partial [Giesbergeria sp.]|nr:ZIP family metal transporter [Giesbergeria sp.]